MQGYLISSLVLILLLGTGIAAIAMTRSRILGDTLGPRPGSGHGDWESALVGYKNLRDKGVLSEEEYRKITTLVEPHVRTDSTPHMPRRPPAAGGHAHGPFASQNPPTPTRN